MNKILKPSEDKENLSLLDSYIEKGIDPQLRTEVYRRDFNVFFLHYVLFIGYIKEGRFDKAGMFYPKLDAMLSEYRSLYSIRVRDDLIYSHFWGKDVEVSKSQYIADCIQRDKQLNRVRARAKDGEIQFSDACNLLYITAYIATRVYHQDL